jgi:hypothetical protein
MRRAPFGLTCQTWRRLTTAGTRRPSTRPLMYAEQGRGQRAVEAAKRLRAQTGRAKNVILFVGHSLRFCLSTTVRRQRTRDGAVA